MLQMLLHIKTVFDMKRCRHGIVKQGRVKGCLQQLQKIHPIMILLFELETVAQKVVLPCFEYIKRSHGH